MEGTTDFLALNRKVVELVELNNVAVDFISIGLKEKSYKAKTFARPALGKKFSMLFFSKLKYFLKGTSDFLASNSNIVQIVELYNFAVDLISIGIK